MADAPDLGSGSERIGGSSPLARTKLNCKKRVTAGTSKLLSLTLLLGAALLAGCASRRYVVTLNNGQRVTAAEKPHLEGFNFVFTDLNGRTNSIPSVRVRAIEPASSEPPAR